MSNNDQVLTGKINRIIGEGVIPQGGVDFTINNPDLVRDCFGSNVVFAQTVEIEVPTTADSIRTLLPNMSGELSGFLAAWQLQETEHGVLLGRHMDDLSLTGLPTMDKVPPSMRLAGFMGRLSAGMHDLSEF